MRPTETHTTTLGERELSERLDLLKQELFEDLVADASPTVVPIRLTAAEIVRRVQPLLSNN